jgi:hypothetical protein
MKILIVAYARTGSTTITKWIAKSLKYKAVYEPFNKKMPERYNGGDNIVVKEIYNHLKDNNNIEEFIQLFDKVICLTRDNEIDVSISILYATRNEMVSWHTPYIISDDWLNNNKHNILVNTNTINEIQTKIKNIPNTLQITYEGIFNTKEDINRVKEYIGIETDAYDFLLDNKFRYRNRKINLI